MRTVHITKHGCIRAHKMGWTLANHGYETHFVAQQISQAHTGSPYTSVQIFDDMMGHPNYPSVRQLQHSIKLLEPNVDVFHVHNEPNWLFRAVKDVTDKPVIFDIHDWTSLRKVMEPDPIDLKEEKYALDNADGFCVPSMGYLKRIRAITDKPTALVYSMVPSALFPRKIEGGQPGMVYEGGLKGKNDLAYNYEYRNWAKFCQEVAKHSDVYLYTANGGEDLSDYENPRIKPFLPLSYNILLQTMSKHSVGLVGSPIPLQDFEDAMPNKLFEYVSAGIPVIIVNAPEAARFAEANGLGVGIQDVSEVKQAIDSLKDHKIAQDRWGYTMESQIPKLMSLYQEVLCTRAPRVIAQRDN